MSAPPSTARQIRASSAFNLSSAPLISVVCVLLSSACTYEPPARWDHPLSRWDLALPSSDMALDMAPDMAPDMALDMALDMELDMELDLGEPDMEMEMSPPPDPLVFRRRYAFELTWENRGQEIDLDLHTLHPTFMTPLSTYNYMGDGEGDLDCHYANLSPDWGEPGPRRNPSLDQDDLVGDLAEVTTFEELEANLLRPDQVGYRGVVHYYGGVLNDVKALIRVFEEGVQIAEMRRTISAEGDAWLFGQLTVNAQGRVIFEPIDQYFSAF